MATLKQRRQRFYFLVCFIILLLGFIFFPKNKEPINITELYPIELGQQEAVINKIKVSVTPFLSHQNDKLALDISLESYEYPKVIHEKITDIILVSVTESVLLSNGQWQLSKEDDYSKYGLLFFDINTKLSESLIVRLFLIDELTLSWPITQQ